MKTILSCGIILTYQSAKHERALIITTQALEKPGVIKDASYVWGQNEQVVDMLMMVKKHLVFI